MSLCRASQIAGKGNLGGVKREKKTDAQFGVDKLEGGVARDDTCKGLLGYYKRYQWHLGLAETH